jgi:dipeptidyl aminopeptidase/acylaminoacyl peptidase
VLPGSRAVVFNVEGTGDSASRRIDLARLDTSERRTLVTGGSSARYVNGLLVYGQAGTLVAARFDLARLVVTAPAVPVLDDVRMDIRSTGNVFADLSPTGTLVYVPGFVRPGERSLVWLDRHGAATPVTAETRPFRGARLSPDGWSLAVTIQDTGSSLWLFDLRRSSWHRLTFTGDVDSPAWTPDGRRIVYSSNAEGPPAIYAVPADGSAPPTRLSPPSTLLIDMPSVSPDGRVALVGVQDARSDDIYALSLDARRALEPFVNTAASETSPAFSPSGQLVAYTSNESGRREVYVRRVAGGGRRWVVSTGGGATPRWRRDERELFYLDGPRLMAVPVDPGGELTIGAPRLLFEEPALAWSNADIARYDVTPDGQRFVTVQPESKEIAPLQIVVVPGFGDELQARLTRVR